MSKSFFVRVKKGSWIEKVQAFSDDPQAIYWMLRRFVSHQEAAQIEEWASNCEESGSLETKHVYIECEFEIEEKIYEVITSDC